MDLTGFLEVMPFRSGALMFQKICKESNDISKPLLIRLGYGIAILVISIRVYNLKMNKN